MIRFKTTSLPAAISGLMLGALMFASPAKAAETNGPSPERLKWSFAGAFGQFDKAQLQRGFQVYREVCGACHSLSRVAIRNLAGNGHGAGMGVLIHKCCKA